MAWFVLLVVLLVAGVFWELTFYALASSFVWQDYAVTGVFATAAVICTELFTRMCVELSFGGGLSWF